MKLLYNDITYLAYGSNLNKEQMSLRCPDAIPKDVIMIKNWRLVFRGVADIIPAKGFQVPVSKWHITKQCEKSLDIYEGFPRLYGKKLFNDTSKNLYMTYTMNTKGFQLPPKRYLDVIKQGYKDFGIDTTFIDEALDFTHWNQDGRGHIPNKYKSA